MPLLCSATAGLLTEGPRWHAERGELLWVDITEGMLHRVPAPGLFVVHPSGNLGRIRSMTIGA